MPGILSTPIPCPKAIGSQWSKYELIPEQLLYEGTITQTNLFSPHPAEDEVILRTHSADYLQKLKTQTLSAAEQRRIGFPQSHLLTERERIITQGTIDCCAKAFSHGIALNVAGGTHHAFRDRGEGFCLLNDFAVAANHLLHQKLADNLLILDLDVHQGNGTASIFKMEQRVFTFSMHGKNNYPFHKEKSSLDVELPDGIGDTAYMDMLQHHLEKILVNEKPQLVFYLSGVDILETDKFGKLKVTLEGCKNRDTFVFNTLKQLSIPCVVAMGEVIRHRCEPS